MNRKSKNTLSSCVTTIYRNMKYLTITSLLFISCLAAFAQKSKSNTVVEIRGITIKQIIAEQDGAVDTTYLMMGRNSKYTQIVDIVTLKIGSAKEIADLLNECVKMSTESDGTSMQYEGNMISMIGKQLVLFGSGEDSNGYVYLTKAALTKMTEAMAPLK